MIDRRWRTVPVAVLAGLVGLPARAMAEPASIPVAASSPELAAEPTYVIPDFKAITRYIPRVHTKYGSLELGLELIGDWTAFAQDAAGLAQVGLQNDQFQMRSAGIDVTGQIGGNPNITYKLGLQYSGFNTNADQKWTISDFAVNFDLPRWQTRIEVGQIRGSFSYEVVGSFVKMPQAERTLGPFVAPRNPGIKVIHAIGAEKRMTATVSLYQDQAESAGGSLGGAARFTVLAFGPGADGNGYLHLGGSVLFSGSDTAAVWRAKPGSDVAEFYVDTGNFAVNGSTNLGLEALYSNGHGWSLQSEYVVARVDSVAFGNVGFRGFYALGSWVLTGEFRPYDRDAGVAGRIVPRSRWGAPEVFARWSMVDLNDGAIAGGQYDRLELGINWWATTEWKLGVVAGRIWLNRFGETGVTDTVLTRLQFVY